MTISIFWRPASDSGKRLSGTSGQYDALRQTFGERDLRQHDAPMLKAMHFATGQKESLFLEIAEVLENVCDAITISHSY